MGVEQDLVSRLGEVRSWRSLALPEDRQHFRNFGMGAIHELGDDKVPPFSRVKDLTPPYTGFVGDLKVSDGSVMNPGYLEKADFAYLVDGQIAYTQKDKSDLLRGLQRVLVSWRDGNFRIDEEYRGAGFPNNRDVELSTRKRTAEFVAEDLRVRTGVSQEHTGGIDIQMDTVNEEGTGYGVGAVCVAVDPKHPQYQAIRRKMRTNPELFSDPKNTVPLLRDMVIKKLSLVYYGFKDGVYGTEYDPWNRCISEPLSFEKAIAIAFPKLMSSG